ncbi:MAG: MarR family winged helix-turn-helix transcriptional regulator [Rhodoglobus sp.]
MSGSTPDESELWRVFSLMRRQLDLALERRLHADAGISTADYEILASLAGEPGHRLRAGQIGDLIGWEKSRVSHQISRMQERGLLCREGCGNDGRGVWVALTAEGRRIVHSAMRDHDSAVREHFFDVLTAEEKRSLDAVSHNILNTLSVPQCGKLPRDG